MHSSQNSKGLFWKLKNSLFERLNASSSGKFEQISFKELKSLLASKSQTNKNYVCRLRPGRSEELSKNGEKTNIKFGPLQLYYFNTDVIVNTQNSSVFNNVGTPFIETYYNRKPELYDNDLPNLEFIKEFEKIENLIVLSHPRWHGHFHNLLETTINRFIHLTYFTSAKKFHLQNDRIINKASFLNLLNPKHRFITSDNFIRANKVLTSNVLFSNENIPDFTDDFLHKIIEEIPIDKTIKSNKKIYSTRNDFCKRPLKNRKQVEGYFKKKGYEIVDFDILTLLQQIEIVRSASIVIGPHGANLANAFFANEGTKFVELVPSSPDINSNKEFKGYERLAAIRKLDYYKYIDDPFDAGSNNWLIDMERLKQFMKSHKI